MNKRTIFSAIFAWMILVGVFSACGNTVGTTIENLSDEQVLLAVKNYCYTINPDLEDIVNAGEYPVYWEISSGDEQEIVVLFRSYTGAQIRYYVNRTTGDTYITEYVPGITTEEERTDENFNVKDYLPQS